jgi:hypothetical protein
VTFDVSTTTLAAAPAPAPTGPDDTAAAVAEPIPLEQELPSRLRVEPWDDPVVDHLGHDPRSAYVEQFWLPILGPSTTLLLRRLATVLDQQPEGTDVDLATTARSLGLGNQGGKRSAFLRALDRSTQFGLAQQLGKSRLAVRRRVPPLTQRQVVRLPKALQGEHARWMEEHRPRTETSSRQRARVLALDLTSGGMDVDDVERQLGRWGQHPAVAYDASRWAQQRHQDALAALNDEDRATA